MINNRQTSGNQGIRIKNNNKIISYIGNLGYKNEKRELNQYLIGNTKEKGENVNVNYIIILAFSVNHSNSKSKIIFNTYKGGQIFG